MDTSGVARLSASSWAGLDRSQRSQTGAVRVVVVDGTGLLSDDADDEVQSRVLSWFGRPDVLSVVTLSGRPTPAQLAIGLACDLRIGSADVTFQLPPQVRPGLVTALGAAAGRGTATAMLLTGRVLTSTQARLAGLLDDVAETSGLDAAVEAVVEQLLHCPREAATELKALLRAGSQGEADRAFTAEAAARDRLAQAPVDSLG